MVVFVTDAENRATLAITRSLGRLGHEVVVGGRHLSCLAHSSRYCAAAVQYPDPVHDSGAFVEAIARITRERRVDALIPVGDITTFLITGNREKFSCGVPFAPAAVVERAADKVDVLRTAERIGLPVPRSVLVSSASEAAAGHALGFPVVIKPWRSRVPTPSGWASSSVSYAADAGQLARDLGSRPAHEFPILLQERVIGPGMGIFTCYRAGKPVLLFGHRRLRERPPWGGVSVLSESVSVDPVAAGFATRLLDAIGWEGVAMVEFKLDDRDGLPKLMEINGRFWGSLQLAIDAGVNFPEVLLRAISGQPDTPQPPYRIGVRDRWFWGDVDSLLVTMFGGAGRPPMTQGRGRLSALAAFARSGGADLHYDNPKRDDPWPFVVETRDWLRRLISRD